MSAADPDGDKNLYSTALISVALFPRNCAATGLTFVHEMSLLAKRESFRAKLWASSASANQQLGMTGHRIHCGRVRDRGANPIGPSPFSIILFTTGHFFPGDQTFITNSLPAILMTFVSFVHSWAVSLLSVDGKQAIILRHPLNMIGG